jgi:tetratricopeptide (TPR) repeat protein
MPGDSSTLAFVAAAAVMAAAAFSWVLRPLVARHRRVVLAVAAAVPLAAAALYAFLGNVRAVDETRMVDATTAMETVPAAVLRDDLVAQLARNPRDARGWVMLARLDLAQDRFADAAQAYERALATSPKADGDPTLWCEYADALGMAQGGSLAGRPRELVMKALARDPTHSKALEMAGSSAYDERDYAGAARHWRTLLAQLAPGSPEARELTAAIASAELRVAAGEPSRGELLYETNCVSCHSKEIHWRDRRLVTDWVSLTAQTRRWQSNAGLRWSDEDVEEVARYLNATIYRFPVEKQTG